MADERWEIGWAAFALATGLTMGWLENAHAATQRDFASPRDGFNALADAIKRDDLKALEVILGPDGQTIIYSGDQVADANARKAFSAAYATKNTISTLDDAHVAIAIGNDGWEFPIPLTKVGAVWRFDLTIGKQEVLNRRIGRNEISAIQASLAYVDAQRDFAGRMRGGSAIPYYAQRMVSSTTGHDGLYWPATGNEPASPLGPLFAQAQSEGYATPKAQATPSAPRPYHGYVYKILTAQGPAARGGALNYLVNGKMIGGYALVAAPASYGASGIMTFMVNHDGKVFQKDLGPSTAQTVGAMTAFNPDKSWTAAQ